MAGFKITHLWAFVAIDPKDGDEGIIGFNSDATGNVMLPMIASDKVRLDQYRPIAKNIAKRMGVKVKLLKFSAREELPEDGS